MTGKKLPPGGIPGIDLSDPKQLAEFARYVVKLMLVSDLMGNNEMHSKQKLLILLSHYILHYIFCRLHYF